ncbi:MAG: hypothetical protein IE914_03125 [Thiotrichales bacterium]|nr:hypothetical protein [Thiotrichales bacterium]
MASQEFCYPEDESKVRNFVVQNFGSNAALSVNGIKISLRSDDGIIWYTSPYGEDGFFYIRDKSGIDSIETLIDDIKKVALYWREPRSEYGEILDLTPSEVL